jgi:hypothetical protein
VDILYCIYSNDGTACTWLQLAKETLSKLQVENFNLVEYLDTFSPNFPAGAKMKEKKLIRKFCESIFLHQKGTRHYAVC